ncbi:MAG: FG-GAP-like repeat-containing protein, partial [Bacteroidota bacterium]
QSAVDQKLVVGLGTLTDSVIDRIHIFWANGRSQSVENIPLNKKFQFNLVNAFKKQTLKEYLQTHKKQPTLFSKINPQKITFQHRENKYNDFNAERLLPHMLSTQGPALAISDVNADGLDDIYFGGAANQQGELYLQLENGTFKKASASAFKQDQLYEDVDAVFFDADGDGDQDLMVASAGNQLTRGSALLSDRLYLNDGRGNFKRTKSALPSIRENTAIIKPTDMDSDGDIDLFIGVRNIPGAYGISAPSFLLENNGKGSFKDVTESKAPILKNAGMLTDAAWIFNTQTTFPDLVICGEWMPLRYFKNDGKTFKEITEDAGLEQASGWWHSLKAADIDNDGDTDLIVGNLGLNSILKASDVAPLQLTVKDIDKSGNLDPIITYFKPSADGNKYPYTLAGRDELIDQMSYIRKEFPTYANFSSKKFSDIFSDEQLVSSDKKNINELSSVIFINEGNGQFHQEYLPLQAQFYPIFASLVADINQDGVKDILTAGNFFGIGPTIGKYDAGYGALLLSDGNGQFNFSPNSIHGLWLDGEVRKMKIMTINGKKVLVAVINNAHPLFHTIDESAKIN